MSPLYKASKDPGHQVVFKTGQDGVRWLALELLKLEAGQQWDTGTDEQEVALILLSGRCDVDVIADGNSHWEDLGARETVFEAPATCVYVPRRSTLRVRARTALEAAIARSPSSADLPPALVLPEDAKIVSSGALNWQREVRLLIPPGSPLSERMIVGETVNPPGNWSGIPPHKHDRVGPDENFLEEFYYFKIDPSDGYGIQLMYRNGDAQGHIISQDSVAVMLEGYHPTVAAPGSTIYYLWVLAGATKEYKIQIDPRFKWIAEAEAAAKAVTEGQAQA